MDIPTNHIVTLAGGSALAKVQWADRGRAPIGYIKGFGLAYARCYTKFKAGDPAMLDVAKKATNDTVRDALAWYSSIFKKAGLDNSANGVSTFRHVFVLLVGLAMRESSGRYCEGRDRSASNVSADTAEAGLYQQSWNSRVASPFLPRIFAAYKAAKDDDGYLSVFQEGVKPTKSGLQNYGTGDGAEFQRLAKANPTFATECAAVAVRHIRKHFGTINRREVQIRQEADLLLHQIEGAVNVIPHDADVKAD